MTILKLEENFSKAFIELADNAEKLFSQIVKNEKIDFHNKEISKAILIRLKNYYEYQQRIKKLLNKKYMQSAADFFVETIVFYLKTFFKTYGLPLDVHSEEEKQIEKGKRKAIRPDIAIWRNDEVVAIIECKTQLGRSRENWKKQFSEREAKLKKYYPNASIFFIAMTSSNWHGFGEDKNAGKKYFCLSNVWPIDIKIDKLDDYLLNPIEPIISSFVKKLKKLGNTKNSPSLRSVGMLHSRFARLT